MPESERSRVTTQRLERTMRILEGAAVSSAKLVRLAESVNLTIRQMAEELVWYHGLFSALNKDAALKEGPK